MSIITRPAKEGGHLTYAAKVLAGFLTIIDTEVDADFDTIYEDHNGNLTNANIAAGAAIDSAKLATIPYSKLNLTGSIVNADIATAAAIARSKLAGRNATFALITAGLNVTTTETPIWSSSFAVVDTSVLMLPATALWATVNSGAGAGTVTWRWKRNGVTQLTISQLVGAALVAAQVYPLTPPGYADLTTAGTYTYSLTVQTSTVAIAVGSHASNPGGIYALEF